MITILVLLLGAGALLIWWQSHDEGAISEVEPPLEPAVVVITATTAALQTSATIAATATAEVSVATDTPMPTIGLTVPVFSRALWQPTKWPWHGALIENEQLMISNMILLGSLPLQAQR